MWYVCEQESNYKKSRRDMAWSVWLNYLRAGRGWLFGPLYLILSIIAVVNTYACKKLLIDFGYGF